MSNQEVLAEATRIAIQNGWKGSPLIDDVKRYQELASSKLLVDVVYGENWWELTLLLLPPHDYAKALWGEEHEEVFDTTRMHHCKRCGHISEDNYPPGTCWEYHLQQMVIAEDPIKYLEENLPS